ncbi:T9SS type A sorting domain-containing protein [candidate division WOR-3 bacterium]|nr:T9SS type A sorting domain-containing protein [candidate division WOR-3 bacterium]
MFFSIEPLQTITGTFEYQRLGEDVLCFGDINGDGYDDLMYTAKNFSSVYPTIWVLFGGANFDNIPDVELTYYPPYYGNFAYATWSCDLNLDGYDDVIASNPIEFGQAGDRGREIFIYFGAADISGIRYPDITIPCPAQVNTDYYEFGLDLCTVNYCTGSPPVNDDYPAIVVGCPQRIGQALKGRVFVYRGPDYQTYVELHNPLPGVYGDRLGFSVTTADFNNDRTDEIVAGAYGYNGERGALVVWWAWEDCPVMDMCVDPPVSAGARFGWDLSAGDLTNDEFSDLAVSAFRAYPNKVFVSYGHRQWGMGGPWNFNQTLVSLDNPNYDFFGICIGYCGDVNNDGIGDLVVGACQNGTGGVGNGYAAVYFGGDGTIDDQADYVIYGEHYDSGLGYEVNIQAGDMNGDEYCEIVASAPYYDGSGYLSVGKIYIHGEVSLLSDNPLALAYNGNRHLARTPRGDALHLVYTSDDKIFYLYSSNGGSAWQSPTIIGEGQFPAITLDSDHLPSVAWTDEEGGLWYRRQAAAGIWGPVYHLDDPAGSDVLHLNSPPAMSIIPGEPNDIVHILVTRSGLIPQYTYAYAHTLEDFAFPINDPGQGWFDIIEERLGPLEPPLRSFPSVTRDFENTLHLVWQRLDTVCYAVKPPNEWWDNWGPQFETERMRSAHPFVETYGDSIFVVWQHRETPSSKEEVWRARRHLAVRFRWANLSRTPGQFSLYPINASGLATTFVDEIYPTPPDGEYEVYWKRTPDDPLHNISNSTSVRSIYPQTALRFDQVADNHLYVIWQEGNEEPYQIKFKREFVPDPPPAFFTSDNGRDVPSPYLVERDTFFAGWTVPVDVGFDSVSYRFRLEPGYFYILKGIVYHQGTGQWRGWVRFDGAEPFQIAYNACLPETVVVMIPPSLYEDSVLSVTLGRDNGDFITVGSIYIYRYETFPGGGGGPLSYRDDVLNEHLIRTWPNPFVQQLSIEFAIPAETEITISIYDVAGRLVKYLHKGAIGSAGVLRWQGEDEIGKTAPQGVYFLRVEDPATNKSICRKIIKVD